MENSEAGWWTAVGLMLVAGVLTTAAGAFGAVGGPDTDVRVAQAQAATERLRHGETLVRATGCGDCHTPKVFDKALGMPVPDRAHQLSGHPQGAPDPQGTLGPADMALIGPTFTSFRTQLGLVYAVNLTPDKATGLGSWSEQDFIRTLRTGKHLGTGREILPPMPWMDTAALSDADLGAMFAYLRSLPPVANPVPPPKVDAKAVEGYGRAMEQMRTQMKGAPRP